MSATYMTRQELCDAVYNTVKAAEKPLSRLEICRAIGRKKAPHILNMIEELTAGGWFKKAQTVDKWRRPVLVYEIGKTTDLDCSQKG